jgi:hypothetical protein
MNTLKKKHLEQVVAYFIKIGRIPTQQEYRADPKVPIRPVLLRRFIGNYARVLRLVKHNFPNEWEILTEEPSEISEESSKISEEKKPTSPKVKKPEGKDV